MDHDNYVEAINLVYTSTSNLHKSLGDYGKSQLYIEKALTLSQREIPGENYLAPNLWTQRKPSLNFKSKFKPESEKASLSRNVSYNQEVQHNLPTNKDVSYKPPCSALINTYTTGEIKKEFKAAFMKYGARAPSLNKCSRNVASKPRISMRVTSPRLDAYRTLNYSKTADKSLTGRTPSGGENALFIPNAFSSREIKEESISRCNTGAVSSARENESRDQSIIFQDPDEFDSDEEEHKQLKELGILNWSDNEEKIGTKIVNVPRKRPEHSKMFIKSRTTPIPLSKTVPKVPLFRNVLLDKFKNKGLQANKNTESQNFLRTQPISRKTSPLFQMLKGKTPTSKIVIPRTGSSHVPVFQSNYQVNQTECIMKLLMLPGNKGLELACVEKDTGKVICSQKHQLENLLEGSLKSRIAEVWGEVVKNSKGDVWLDSAKLMKGIAVQNKAKNRIGDLKCQSLDPIEVGGFSQTMKTPKSKGVFREFTKKAETARYKIEVTETGSPSASKNEGNSLEYTQLNIVDPYDKKEPAASYDHDFGEQVSTANKCQESNDKEKKQVLSENEFEEQAKNKEKDHVIYLNHFKKLEEKREERILHEIQESGDEKEERVQFADALTDQAENEEKASIEEIQDEEEENAPVKEIQAKEEEQVPSKNHEVPTEDTPQNLGKARIENKDEQHAPDTTIQRDSNKETEEINKETEEMNKEIKEINKETEEILATDVFKPPIKEEIQVTDTPQPQIEGTEQNIATKIEESQAEIENYVQEKAETITITNNSINNQSEEIKQMETGANYDPGSILEEVKFSTASLGSYKGEKKEPEVPEAEPTPSIEAISKAEPPAEKHGLSFQSAIEDRPALNCENEQDLLIDYIYPVKNVKTYTKDPCEFETWRASVTKIQRWYRKTKQREIKRLQAKKQSQTIFSTCIKVPIVSQSNNQTYIRIRLIYDYKSRALRTKAFDCVSKRPLETTFEITDSTPENFVNNILPAVLLYFKAQNSFL
eukprot:TRINITY_DN811_c0_g1_i2.p1 TRINITY_DN811_c0_g1~~TRINITY_DN811_c0_g1_i2.p1  ORF type:complete len:993 (+),score=127.39 TRINITY_DN811_c0_g1_i2:7815-10793(+)